MHASVDKNLVDNGKSHNYTVYVQCVIKIITVEICKFLVQLYTVVAAVCSGS